jgi:hypothetical protein
MQANVYALLSYSPPRVQPTLCCSRLFRLLIEINLIYFLLNLVVNFLSQRSIAWWVSIIVFLKPEFHHDLYFYIRVFGCRKHSLALQSTCVHFMENLYLISKTSSSSSSSSSESYFHVFSEYRRSFDC